jgi:hypothetical protein
MSFIVTPGVGDIIMPPEELPSHQINSGFHPKLSNFCHNPATRPLLKFRSIFEIQTPSTVRHHVTINPCPAFFLTMYVLRFPPNISRLRSPSNRRPTRPNRRPLRTSHPPNQSPPPQPLLPSRTTHSITLLVHRIHPPLPKQIPRRNRSNTLPTLLLNPLKPHRRRISHQ